MSSRSYILLIINFMFLVIHREVIKNSKIRFSMEPENFELKFANLFKPWAILFEIWLSCCLSHNASHIWTNFFQTDTKLWPNIVQVASKNSFWFNSKEKHLVQKLVVLHCELDYIRWKFYLKCLLYYGCNNY